jgi:two-component sensor histidine kinase
MRRQNGATRDQPIEGAWSLRFRLLLTVTIALLPIAVVSVLQGLDRASIDVAAVRERLIDSAQAAASNEEDALASGEQILHALGNIDDVRNVTPDCDRALFDALIGVRYFTNLARADPHGRVVCAALPQAKGMTVNDALFAGARHAGFAVSGQLMSPVTHRAVIGGMLALYDKSHRFQGTISFAMDVGWLSELIGKRNLPGDAMVCVFDRKGTIIAATNPAVAHAIFSRPQAANAPSQDLGEADDAAGKLWSYAVAPLRGGNVFVGFAMPSADLYAPTYLHVGTNFMLPIVMIGLAWAAIWFATERQITQWISYLKRISAAYRGGHYGVRPVLDHAPTEFRLLGNAMAEMAEGIQDRDRRLRDAVTQKTMLIKEIHHRVKNNLQIVMSLLSLQAAQLKEPAVRDVLTQAQMRINALALVHRILHEIEDQTTVDVGRMLRELTQQIVGGMAGEHANIEYRVDAAPRPMAGDVAVPLALFAVEALTNIFKHAFPNAPDDRIIRVTLSGDEGGMLHLAVTDNGIGYPAADEPRSVGSRLIRTFAQQLGGTIIVQSGAGKGTAVELVFPDPALNGTQAGRVEADA